MDLTKVGVYVASVDIKAGAEKLSVFVQRVQNISSGVCVRVCASICLTDVMTTVNATTVAMKPTAVR